MRPILDFFLNMESKRWRALLATLVLFAVIVALFAVGKSSLGLGQGVDGAEARLEDWLVGFRSGPWGLFAAIVLFTLSAFLGVPQFILIAACVVAFGPTVGFFYSWAATVASAGVTYWLGRGPTARPGGGAPVVFQGRNGPDETAIPGESCCPRPAVV